MKNKISLGVHDVEIITSSRQEIKEKGSDKVTVLYKASVFVPAVSEDVEIVYLTSELRRGKIKAECFVTGKTKNQLKLSLKPVEEKKVS